METEESARFDGSVADVWTGLTMVTGIAVGPDANLYALEMATGNITKPPYTGPGTGRIVRQAGPDSLAEVVVGLGLPLAMALGPDDALHVSLPAYGRGARRHDGQLDQRRHHPHTMTADDGSFDSGNVAPHERFAHRVESAGI